LSAFLARASTPSTLSSDFLNGFDDRLGAQHHPGPAAVGPLVDLAPLIAGKVAQLVDLNLELLLLLRAPQN
jgi:hypothetical protein